MAKSTRTMEGSRPRLKRAMSMLRTSAHSIALRDILLWAVSNCRSLARVSGSAAPADVNLQDDGYNNG